jgi:hypothetical protein
VRRLILAALVGGAFAFAPAATNAVPPAPPPACNVVLGTPAGVTGSDVALGLKEATFTRLCLPD